MPRKFNPEFKQAFSKKLLSIAVCGAVSGLLPGQLAAQEVEQIDDALVEEVVVYGDMRATLQSAQDLKRDGDTVKDVITASDIGALPDKSVTEALQRVPGVSIERFAASEYIDEERIARAIEYTRFPVPEGPEHAETDTERALVRAADLIGQMGDPFYRRKTNALYQEFVETGVARQLGYTSAMDMVEQYPEFFWSQVQPLIQPALVYLEYTTEGKQWLAQLYNQVFQVERRAVVLGPFPG